MNVRSNNTAFHYFTTLFTIRKFRDFDKKTKTRGYNILIRSLSVDYDPQGKIHFLIGKESGKRGSQENISLKSKARVRNLKKICRKSLAQLR